MYLFTQSFRSLPQKPLSVDLTVEEGQRLKVIYGSLSGFHAIDVDSGTPYDLYLPTHVRVSVLFTYTLYIYIYILYILHTQRPSSNNISGTHWRIHSNLANLFAWTHGWSKVKVGVVLFLQLDITRLLSGKTNSNLVQTFTNKLLSDMNWALEILQTPTGNGKGVYCLFI